MTKERSDVLLVEHDAPVRETIARHLEGAGHRVRPAASAAEALQALQDGASRAPLIVTEILLPDMDGVTFAEEVRRGDPRARILFVAGVREAAERPLPGPLVMKPFDEDEIVLTVRLLGLAR